jgi:RimJ/RimL family protein N-acetyltransferase
MIDPFTLAPPAEFDSDRLLMRSYRPEDAGMYYGMVHENWDHLYEFLPENVEKAHNEADMEDVIHWLDSQWEQRNIFLFGIWDKAAGSYAGEVYLANPDWHVPSIELGYFLVQSSTGKGYATEAARAAIRYAFDHFKVIRLDLQCRADNEASQRVAERCGFHLEGCQRLRHRKKSGKLVDRLWYGLLREEWEGSKAG